MIMMYDVQKQTLEIIIVTMCSTQMALTCPKMPVKYSAFTSENSPAFPSSIMCREGPAPFPWWWYIAANLFHSSPLVCLLCCYSGLWILTVLWSYQGPVRYYQAPFLQGDRGVRFQKERLWLSQIQVPSSQTQPKERSFRTSLGLSTKTLAGPMDCPPDLVIFMRLNRGHRSCSVNGSNSTWEKNSSSQTLYKP